MVAMSMPQLDTLSIRPSAPVYERYTYKKIATRIATYQAPASCKRLPLLSVGSKQFLECQEFMVNDRRLRYMSSPDNPLDSDSDYNYEDSYDDHDYDYEDSYDDHDHDYEDSYYDDRHYNSYSDT